MVWGLRIKITSESSALYRHVIILSYMKVDAHFERFDRKIKMESIMSEYLKSVYTSQFMTGYHHLELMEHDKREKFLWIKL